MTRDAVDFTDPTEVDAAHMHTVAELRTTTHGQTILTAQRRHIRVDKIPYHEREFIAWDGESVDDAPARYLLFGCSTGRYIRSDTQLSTADCLQLICDIGRQNPHTIHVSFAFKFDVTMILADLSSDMITRLHKTGRVYYGQWNIKYVPGKWFSVFDRVTKVFVRIFDVFTFFACSFIAACQQYLPNDPTLEFVSSGKDQRDRFTQFDMDTLILPYWTQEIALLTKLCVALRDSLISAGIFVTMWHGPGAVATALLKRHKIDRTLSRSLPNGVIDASQHAYYGGRFEQFRCGQYDGDVYSYDIRSAYPAALAEVPNIATGEWEHVNGPTADIRPFSLYHIRWRCPVINPGSLLVAMPFPYRDQYHRVHYPLQVDTWIWGIELLAAAEWHDDIDIREAWLFHDNGDRPFTFVRDLYEKRVEWKRDGNPAQLAAKLGMNSLYGKLAQRVGWNEKTLTPPTWHQLEYAGFITAHCRANLYTAIRQAGSSLIATETDGIFTTAPLNLPTGNRLGEWESEQHDGIVYVQSGVYFLRSDGEWKKAKTRGLVRGKVGVDIALAQLDTLTPLESTTRRFATFPLYTAKEEYRNWIDVPHSTVWGGGGKRTHNPACCAACKNTAGQWHSTIISQPIGGYSQKHVLPWRQTDAVNPYWTDDDTESRLVFDTV